MLLPHRLTHGGDAFGAVLCACSAGRLPVSHVIHAVGPVYRSNEESSPLLAATYAFALTLARCYRLRRVAVPALSCGIYGYPHAEAADVFMRVMVRHSAGLAEVTAMIGDAQHVEMWGRAACHLAAAAGASGKPWRRDSCAARAAWYVGNDAAVRKVPRRLGPIDP
jgi:hypothetical protein